MTKVWIIEYGAYSDRYTCCAFTTRELAIGYLLKRHGFTTEEELKAAEGRDRSGAYGYPPEDYDLWDAIPHAEAET